jgi:hypothetical protein
MSVQSKLYIEEMKDMYKKIVEKTDLTLNDILFLITYKKTIDNSIEIPFA